MRRAELGVILVALAGIVASVVWIVASRAGGPAAKASPVPASITKLAPLTGTGSREATDGAGLAGLREVLPVPTYDISGRVISKVNVDKKLIALSFDDGPSRRLAKILATLDRYDARATFFVVTSRIAKHASWLNDIVTQGSEVANHTETHLQLDRASASQIAAELDNSQAAIEQILGQKPMLMRPPVGRYNQAVVEAARSRKLAITLWSIHSQDTGGGGARQIAGRVVAAASPGDIVLLHETGAHTLEALPLMLSQLRAEGYEFVTVTQLLAAGNLP